MAELVTKTLLDNRLSSLKVDSNQHLYFNDKENVEIDDYTPYVSRQSDNGVYYKYPSGAIISKYPIKFKASKDGTTVMKSQYIEYLITESGYYVYNINLLNIEDQDMYCVDGYVYEFVRESNA